MFNITLRSYLPEIFDRVRFARLFEHYDNHSRFNFVCIVRSEWIDRISFLRNPNIVDMISMFLPVSLAMTIMSVGCITCGGHGLITGTMFYYANVSIEAEFIPTCLFISISTNSSGALSYKRLYPRRSI